MYNITIRSILIASDGLEGIELNSFTLDTTIYFFLHCSCAAALEVSRDIKVDLFLINCLSPAMSGATFCQQLHALPDLHDVPTIITEKTLDMDTLFQMIGLLAVA
jgi:CheY-like chemotaxis protein